MYKIKIIYFSALLIICLFFSFKLNSNQSRADVFQKNIAKIYRMDIKNSTKLVVENLTPSQIKDEAYCIKNKESLLIYLKSDTIYSVSQYAKMTKDFYTNYSMSKFEINDKKSFLPKCTNISEKCEVGPFNGNRNLIHRSVFLQSALENNQVLNKPIWVVEKSSNIISFNIEPCFE